MLRTPACGWVGWTHLLQHMKVQPRLRMKMTRMKLVRMTYRTLHSEEEEEPNEEGAEDSCCSCMQAAVLPQLLSPSPR